MTCFLAQKLALSLEPKPVFFRVCGQVIPGWLVLEATGYEQSELSLLCCRSTSIIRQLSSETNPLPQAAP